jgi:hypothetical protein
MWFAHDEKNAKKHGERILKFKLKKSIKLIDISNQIFHMDFIAKINNEKSPNIDTTKFDPLIAIGLPDLRTQINYIGLQKNGLYPNNNHYDENEKKNLDIIEKFVSLFGNKHRFSSQKNPDTDILLVNSLIRLYPDFDGYICSNFWPSYHHGGFLIPETCLFKPLDCILEDKSGGKKIIGSGRSKKKKTYTTKKIENGQIPGSRLNEYGGYSFNIENGQIPGSRLNEYGGYSLNIEDYCRELGINFEDLIVVNKKIYE